MHPRWPFATASRKGCSSEEAPRPILAAFGDEQPRLARILQGRVRCGAAAADLLQDVWLKLAGRETEAGAVNDPHVCLRARRRPQCRHRPSAQGAPAR